MTNNRYVNSLQSICTRTEQVADITTFYCQVPSGFYGFKGHFEGQPILPGVCQLQLVNEAIAQVSGPISIARIDKMKFHNLILPDTSFLIEVEPVSGGWRYRLFNGDGDFASGKLVSR